MTSYRSTPEATTHLPKGIPFIIGNELAERFSFYGMKGILTIFMTKHLMDSSGAYDTMNDEQAKTVYHLFTAAAYFFPLLGSLLADILWGKFKTIMILSLGYCVGHACLAIMDLGPMTGLFGMRPWMYMGLLFIAVGAGGIKPCVSANVGDQFGTQNQHLVSKVFSWFYFSINVGAMASTLITPVLLAKVGPWAAFGLPGVLMGIATLIFWLGRKKFVHVPPAGLARFKQETLSPDGLRAVFNLAPVFLIFIPMFWAIFDQTGSAWVLQAEHMDRQFLGVMWYESQVQAVNPFLILVLIPFFAYAVYPLTDKYLLRVTPLRKIGAGLFLTAVAFSLSAMIEQRIMNLAPGAASALWAALGTTGEASYAGLVQALAQARAAQLPDATVEATMAGMPNIAWQFLAYVILTAAEVMVSITSLEFAYTQAPRKMKSFIMGIYFLGVSLGNLFTSGVNYFIQNADGSVKLDGAQYYWFFTALMAATAVVFVIYAQFYKGRTYIQGEGEPNSTPRLCPRCSYNLTGVKSDQCPECGLPIAVSH
jgi:POT family proton-dependent oligopeptide transporter